MTVTVAHIVLGKAIATYRADDLPRLDPYWEADTLDAFSRELFGTSVAGIVGVPAADLLRDWRLEAYTAVAKRVGAAA